MLRIWLLTLLTLLHALVILLASESCLAAEQADLILVNGRIVTVDADFQVAAAMAVKDGRIIAVGERDARLEGFIGDKTQVLDLQGQMVLPGLIDSHTHPADASMFEFDHEIPGMESIADVLQYVRQRAGVLPQGEWIYVSQVFITRLREQRYPTRAELDAAAPNHPVLFRTGPDGSANSLAMKLNGIDKAFARQHPQNVMVDSVSGEPNGILRKASSVLTVVPDLSQRRVTETERDEQLVKLFDDYNQIGITGIIDRNCSDAARAQYSRLLNADRLTVRVRMSRSLDASQDLETIDQRLTTIASDPLFQRPDPRLGVIGVKCFQDGGMLTGSAYFSQPWGVSSIYGIGDPSYRGMQYIELDQLEKIVRACATRNLAFTAHCQGDAAVESLLEVYERVNQDIPIGPTRSTVTHASFMSEKAIALAASLNVGIDLQPAWLYLDARTLLAQFGEQRLEYFIPLRSLMEADVRAGGGSDHMQKIGSLRSVNPYNPFLGMWIAATRKALWHDAPVHSEQALSRQQMIRFYTLNNAFLMRMEEEIGSLEVGKRADFIIIDRDLLTCPDEDIRSTRVHSTWLDGVKQKSP